MKAIPEGLELRHIDNSFYKVPTAYAKAMTIEGRLPKCGYESRVKRSELAKCVLVYSRTRGKPEMHGIRDAWLSRTRVWDKEVWAVHILWGQAPNPVDNTRPSEVR